MMRMEELTWKSTAASEKSKCWTCVSRYNDVQCTLSIFPMLANADALTLLKWKTNIVFYNAESEL